jgi:hypothetical protein
MKKETEKKPDSGIAIRVNNKTFYYNFDLLSMDRILAGEQLFKMYQKALETTPDKANVNSVVSQQLYRHAMAAVIPEQFEDKTFEVYNPELSSMYSEFPNMTGQENYKKLKEIENDFFTKSGIVTIDSIQLLQRIMKDMDKQDIGKMSELLKDLKT